MWGPRAALPAREAPGAFRAQHRVGYTAAAARFSGSGSGFRKPYKPHTFRVGLQALQNLVVGFAFFIVARDGISIVGVLRMTSGTPNAVGAHCREVNTCNNDTSNKSTGLHEQTALADIHVR